MPAEHISTKIPAAAEAADRNGEVCALVSDIPMRYRRMEFNAQLQNEVNSLQLELAAERNKSESLRAQLHGMQDGSLLRDTQAALSAAHKDLELLSIEKGQALEDAANWQREAEAANKRADAAEADAKRLEWVLPIINGAGELGDKRALIIAVALGIGFEGRAAIDEAMK